MFQLLANKLKQITLGGGVVAAVLLLVENDGNSSGGIRSEIARRNCATWDEVGFKAVKFPI